MSNRNPGRRGPTPPALGPRLISGTLPPIMVRLGVNIDHVATLRQARRTYEPDPAWAAAEAQLGGADCITVHLREDRRHIQDDDLARVQAASHVKLNLEMAATDEMLRIAMRTKPHMVTLVPEGRQEVTTEGGLDVAAQAQTLKQYVKNLTDAGIMAAAFIDPADIQVHACADAGFDACEIHTGPYALAFHAAGQPESPPVRDQIALVAGAGERINQLGMRFHAGHALTYTNVDQIAALPALRELHIGHCIISRAVFVGLRRAVREMKDAIRVGTPT